MIKVNLSILMMLFCAKFLSAQALLNADGEGNTYELINSVLAPNGDVVEPPDCSHPEFGRHIDEVYDSSLQMYVFRFHIHVTPDNDRCKNFDRQRNEIKTYDQSPDSLKGVLGETFEYKWKFKIDSNFQASSSFTHLHQIKAVGGTEADMPLITLTPRKGTPDKLELRYAAHLTQETLKKVNLDPFKGSWVNVTEKVTYGEPGIYSLKIIKVDSEEVLFDYTDSTLRLWKTDASFMRPKWGIYRSLNNSNDLRDEMLYFADFSILETQSIVEPDTIKPTLSILTTAIEPVTGVFKITITFSEQVIGFGEESLSVENGSVISGSVESNDNIIFTASILPNGSGNVSIKVDESIVTDESGNKNEASNKLEVLADMTIGVKDIKVNSIRIFPNPTKGILNIMSNNNQQISDVLIFDQSGRILYKNDFCNNSVNLNMSDFKAGIYLMRIKANEQFSYCKIFVE